MSDQHEQRPPRNIDERIDTLTMNLELLTHDVHELLKKSALDAESIRSLARTAEIHDRSAE